MLTPALRYGPHAFFDPLLVSGFTGGPALGCDPATRRAERGDGVEQAVLRFGWQVTEQAFGAPCAGLIGVETCCLQRSRPVVAQIDGDRAPVGGGLGAQLGQRAGLEFDDFRLVDFVHRGAVRPGQPVSARVQSGRQDHRLPDPRVGRVDEELVEEFGADRHVVGHPLHAGRRAVAVVLEVGGGQLAGGQPGEQVQAHRPNQRLGIRVVDQWAVGLARHSAGCRDHRGCRADARCQVPSVLIGACHRYPSA